MKGEWELTTLKDVNQISTEKAELVMMELIDSMNY